MRNSKTPLVSIITPVYGVEKYIEKCAESLFNQTLRDVEFIFVIDVSPDKSLDVLRRVVAKYPERNVKIIEQPENMGSAAARQMGIENAQGDYTIHVDSDDWCELNMLEELYNCALHTNADIVVCDYFVNFVNGKQIYKSQKAAPNGKECAKMLLDGQLHGSMCNKLVRRSLYEANSINFEKGVNMWEDLIVTTQLCYYAKTIIYLPKSFLHYNQTNPNSYVATRSNKSLGDMIMSVEIFENFFSSKKDSRDFTNSILQRKLLVKLELSIFSRGDTQAKYMALFPEVSRAIFTAKSIPIHHKIALWLTTNNSYRLGNMIYAGINFFKKMSNK